MVIIVFIGPIPAAAKLAYRIERDLDKFNILGHLGLILFFWIICQMLISFCLGLFGSFDVITLLILEAALFLGTIVLLPEIKCRQIWQKIQLAIKDLLCEPQVKSLMIGGAITVGGILIYTLVYPIINGDSLGYHLTNIIHWLQSDTLERWHFHQLTQAYPHNWELVNAIWVLATNSTFFSWVPNFFAWLILGLCTAQISYNLTNKFSFGVISAIWICLARNPILDINSIKPDLALVATFSLGLLAAYYAFKGKHQYLLISLITAVFMIGVKTTGGIYASLILIPILWFSYKRQNFLALIKKQKLLLGLSLATVIISGYWFAINIMKFANPFGPIRLTFGNLEILKGQDLNLSQTTLFQLFDITRLTDWLTTLNQLHLRLGLVIIILLLLSPVVLGGQLFNAKSNFKKLILLTFVFSFCLYITSPFSAATVETEITKFIGNQFRLGYIFLLSLILLFSFLKPSRIIQGLFYSLGYINIILALIFIAFKLEKIPMPWLTMIVLTILGINLFIYRKSVVTKAVAILCTAILVIFSYQLQELNLEIRNNEPLYGTIARYLDTQPASNIGVFGPALLYPYFGIHHQHDLTAANANRQHQLNNFLSNVKQSSQNHYLIIDEQEEQLNEEFEQFSIEVNLLIHEDGKYFYQLR